MSLCTAEKENQRASETINAQEGVKFVRANAVHRASVSRLTSDFLTIGRNRALVKRFERLGATEPTVQFCSVCQRVWVLSGVGCRK